VPPLPKAAIQEQFGTPARQKEAATLAMWVFLGTELLIFSGLFVAYGEYRYTFPVAFQMAGSYAEHGLGLVLTILLLTSSFLATLSVLAARQGKRLATVGLIGLTVALGTLFMVLHLAEWWHHAREGALPGRYYHFDKLTLPGASLFFTLFYLTTGLHMLHVTIGLALLSWSALQALLGRITAEYTTPVEVTVLYWHFVDVIWTFIFPLYYLLARP